MKLAPLTTAVAPPFYEPRHFELAERLARPDLLALRDAHEPRAVAAKLGELGLSTWLVPEALGGAAVGKPDDAAYVDVRSLALIREALGQISPEADALFAVQGLASHPIALAGSAAQREALAGVVRGARVGAFALTEPNAGSDVASMETRAERGEAGGWALTGEKVLISNVPAADFHVIFANADPAAKHRGITAFFVEASAPGLAREAIAMSADHAVGRLVMTGCQVGAGAVVGAPGQGFKLAMQTLDAFRITVGGAAVGMGLRALSLAIERVKTRRQFGAALAEQQMVRAKIADMATELEAARVLVARAAWMRDAREARAGTDAAMAKMFATEAAFRVIDDAVQLHGGSGVVLGAEVERLAREVRPLRIYEGTTEIQKIVIAKALLA